MFSILSFIIYNCIYKFLKNCELLKFFFFKSYFSFSLDTCPGSKIYLKGKVEVEHGFLKLYNRNVNFVGGRVDKIADNWELRKVCVIENKIHKMLSVELEFIFFFLGGGVKV